MKRFTYVLLLLKSLNLFGFEVTTFVANSGITRNEEVVPNELYQLSFDVDLISTDVIEVKVREGGLLLAKEIYTFSTNANVSFVPSSNEISVEFNRIDAELSSKMFSIKNLFLSGESLTRENNAFNKDYEIKDNLSNTRVVKSAIGHVVSSTDYYPFGSNSRSSNEDYRFGFNSAEKDQENVTLDFGNRFYNANLGRWMSIDAFAEFYPANSPFVFVNNNPIMLIDMDGDIITIPDGNGGVVIYSPCMSTEGEGMSAETKKHINYLNNVYAGETGIRMDKLVASEIEYNVHIGSAEAVGIKKGGVTKYDFKNDKVLIKAVEDGDLTGAILGDEFTHAEQFQNGDLGFVEYEGGQSGAAGYDLKDEIESKRGAVDVLNTQQKSAQDLDPENKYESTKVMTLIQEGKDTDDAIHKWLKGTKYYKKSFTRKGNEMDESISAEDGVKKMERAGIVDRTVYVKDGKVIKNETE